MLLLGMVNDYILTIFGSAIGTIFSFLVLLIWDRRKEKRRTLYIRGLFFNIIYNNFKNSEVNSMILEAELNSFNKKDIMNNYPLTNMMHIPGYYIIELHQERNFETLFDLIHGLSIGIEMINKEIKLREQLRNNLEKSDYLIRMKEINKRITNLNEMLNSELKKTLKFL